MASHSNEQIARQISEALAVDRGVSAAALDIPNPTELFCQNWDTVRQVLQVLKQFAPAWLKPLIDLVISGGDTLKGIICPH